MWTLDPGPHGPTYLALPAGLYPRGSKASSALSTEESGSPALDEVAELGGTAGPRAAATRCGERWALGGEAGTRAVGFGRVIHHPLVCGRLAVGHHFPTGQHAVILGAVSAGAWVGEKDGCTHQSALPAPSPPGLPGPPAHRTGPWCCVRTGGRAAGLRRTGRCRR